MGRYDGNPGRYARTKSKQTKGVHGIVVIILIAGAAAAGFFARQLSDDILAPITRFLSIWSESNETVAQKPEPAPLSDTKKPSEPAIEPLEQLPPTAPVVILPELDSSDSEVRKAITAAAPELAPWLATDALIRKFMVLANDFSQGLRINQHLNFAKLAQPFSIQQEGGGLFIATASYQRYNALAQAIDHIDNTALLTVYHTFKPLLQQVFTEFSYPEDYGLDAMVKKAAAQILSAPIIEGPIPLLTHSLRYRFADPQLEALNPVHKQMLRMGSENTRLIQDKIRALIAQIEDREN
jgi:hypothetical protein